MDISKLINNKATEIEVTSEELFNSPEFKAYAQHITEGVTGRWGRVPRVRVGHDGLDGSAAYTDNSIIFLNADTWLINCVDGLLPRFKGMLGLLLHECAHIRFTDFAGHENHRAELKRGEIPAGPLVGDNQRDVDELTEVIKSRQYAPFFIQLYDELSNYGIDRHDENMLIQEYSVGGSDSQVSLVEQCIMRARACLRATSITTEQLLEEADGEMDLSVLCSLIFMYIRFGGIVYTKEETLQTEIVKSLADYTKDADVIATTDSTQEMYEALNRIVLRMWPIIRDKIEAQKQQPPMPGMNGAPSDGGSSGIQGQNGSGSSGQNGSSSGSQGSSGNGSSGSQGQNSSGSGGHGGSGDETTGRAPSLDSLLNALARASNNVSSVENSGSGSMQRSGSSSNGGTQKSGRSGGGQNDPTSGPASSRSGNSGQQAGGGSSTGKDTGGKQSGSSSGSSSGGQGSSDNGSSSTKGQNDSTSGATSTRSGNPGQPSGGTSSDGKDGAETSKKDGSQDGSSGKDGNCKNAEGKDQGSKDSRGSSSNGKDADGKQSGGDSSGRKDGTEASKMAGSQNGSSGQDGGAKDAEGKDQGSKNSRGSSSDSKDGAEASKKDSFQDGSFGKDGDGSSSDGKDSTEASKEDGSQDGSAGKDGNGKNTKGKGQSKASKREDGYGTDYGEDGNQKPKQGDSKPNSRASVKGEKQESLDELSDADANEPDTGFVKNALNAVMDDIKHRIAERILSKENNSQTLIEVRTVNAAGPHKNIHLDAFCAADPTEEDKAKYMKVYEEVRSWSARCQRAVARELEEPLEGSVSRHLQFGRSFDVRDCYRPDQRFYQNRKQPDDSLGTSVALMAVALLVDTSGSTAGPRIEAARKAAVLLYDFCNGLRIPVMLAGHRAFRNTYPGGSVEYTMYAAFDKICSADKYKIMQMCSGGCNRDGMALEITAGLLAKRPEPVRLLITISDGQPNHLNYGGAMAARDIQSIIKRYQKAGVEVFAAAIGNDKPKIQKIYGEGFLDISDLSLLPKTLANIVKKRILRLVR